LLTNFGNNLLEEIPTLNKLKLTKSVGLLKKVKIF
jgi:hypothetical protein